MKANQSNICKLLKLCGALFIDVLASILAFTVACACEWQHIDISIINLVIIGASLTALSIVLLALFHCYRVVWEYAGKEELINILFAELLAFIIAIVVLFTTNLGINFSIVTIYSLVSTLLYLALRYHKSFFSIIFYKVHDKKPQLQNTIIYGAGYTGASLIKRFVKSPADGYFPVAIIDDDKQKIGLNVGGIKVFGDISQLAAAIKKFSATTIIIAIDNIPKEKIKEIYLIAVTAHATVKLVNNISAFSITSEKELSFKNIDIEYLLGRQEHNMNKETINELLCGKIILVTGGAGSIGSEICRQALANNCKKLVIFDRNENGVFALIEELKEKYADVFVAIIGSVQDSAKLASVFSKFKPQIVFHAAAYKHVPLMEINADEAIKNNVMGTQNVICACEQYGVERFVLISTDKAVNPSSVMGATKRIAELILEEHARRCGQHTIFSTVRFGNVLGSSGSVIPTFLRQINKREAVTVTDREMKRYFMSIPEAVRLVISAGALAKGGEVFVLNMGEPVYIYDLAKELISLSGLTPEIDIPIHFTGLRAGEKLFEELQFSDEMVDKTSNDGIYICKLNKYDSEKLAIAVAELIRLAQNTEVEKVEKAIFTLIPSEYRKVI